MPLLTGAFTRHSKPITSVAVIPILPRPGEVLAVPKADQLNVTPLRALLDSGADGTSLTAAVAGRCGLEYGGKERVVGIGGLSLRQTWGTYIGFLYDQNADFEGDNHQSQGLYIVPDARLAIELPEMAEFDVIIGRDILFSFDFRMKDGVWSLDLG